MTDRTFKKSILAASILIFALSQVSAHRPGGGGGGDAVQRTGVIEQCEYPGVDGLFITNEKYAYANASLACESYGGSLADITNQNYLLGADMVLTCIGPNNKAWIGSWDYRDINADPKEGVYDCLGLSVGNIGPGGGVDKSCTGVIPALCQSQPSVVQHNPRYSEPVWAHSQGAAVPTVASTQRETEKNTYPVMYPNFDGGIYRPAIPHGYDDRDTEQGNPVFYPGAGSVWGGSTPQQPREHFKGQYVKPVGYIPEGPNGGFPGGIFPGGPGFGTNGYPYGYPYRYPSQNEWGEDCETVVVNGVVTTITYDSSPHTSTPSASFII